GCYYNSTTFPTRRSSDLVEIELTGLVELRHRVGRQWLRHAADAELRRRGRRAFGIEVRVSERLRPDQLAVNRDGEGEAGDVGRRSEEHTSELQSRSELVC